MTNAYPYIVSNNKVEPILAKIRAAARPERFSRDTLSKWGFTASNDRAMVGVLKELGFLTENGTPTEYYDRLRDASDWRYALAERLRELYSDLFATDTNIQVAPETEIRGAISRITGKDDESVKRYYATFRTLASLANFDPKPTKSTPAKEEKSAKEHEQRQQTKPEKKSDSPRSEGSVCKGPDFHYNIQIHLPVSTDITIYNAIFKSLKEHLNIG